MFASDVDGAFFEGYGGKCAAELICLKVLCELCLTLKERIEDYFFPAEGHTQYTKAQYQHSARNGNFRSKRLRRRSWNTAVFGEVTLQDKLNIPMTRLCQRSSDCGGGVACRGVRVGLGLGLECECEFNRLSFGVGVV